MKASKRWLLALVLTLIGLVALALWLRAEVVQLALHWIAKSQGMAVTAEVVDIDLRQVELRRVAAEGLTADYVRVGYRLSELLDGRLESVRIEGAVLDVDLSHEGDSEASAAQGIAPAGLPVGALPVIELIDARARILLPAGEFVVTGQATLQHADAGELELAARFDASTPWLPIRGRIASRFQGLQPLSLELELEPASDEALASGRVDMRMDALDSSPVVTTDIALSLGSESTAMLPIDSNLSFGKLQLTHKAVVRPGSPLVLAGEQPTSVTEWLGTAEGEAGVNVDVRNLGNPEHVQVHAAGGVSLVRGPDRLHAVVSEPVTFSIGTVKREWLEQLGLPAMAGDLFVEGATVELFPHAEQPLLEVRPDGDAHRAQAAGALRVSSGETRIGLDLALTSPLATHELADAIAALTSIDRTEGRFEIGMEELKVPALLDLRRGQTVGQVSVNGDTFTLSLSDESTAVIELAQSVAATVGPQSLADAVAGPLELRIAARDPARPSIEFRRTGSQASLSLAHSFDVRSTGGPAVNGLLEGGATLDQDFALNDFDVAKLALEIAGLDLGVAKIKRFDIRGQGAGEADRFSGSFHTDLQAADLSSPNAVANALDAELVLDAGFDQGSWHVSAAQPATVRLDTVSLPDRAAAPAMKIGLREGSVTLTPDGIVRLLGFAGDLDLPSVSVLRMPEPPLALQLSGLDWTAEGTVNTGTGDVAGEARLQLSRMLVPEHALALEKVDLTVETGTDGLSAKLLDAQVMETGATPLMPPLALSGEVDPVEPGYRFSFLARGANDRLELRGDGEHAVASGHGKATLLVSPLDLDPGGLQPRDLSPVLSVLEEASGRVEARAELSWGDAGVDGTGLFKFQDLALSYEDTRVSGLNLDLAFEQLFPPRTRAQQSLRVARIDSGVPITDLAAALTVLSSQEESPYILVEQLSAAALGGRILLPRARIDPLAGRQQFTLELDPVELAALTDVIALEELKGRGALVGRFPVRVEGENLIIDGGRLQASEPGTLSFRSAQTRQTLAPGGETLELMLRALEDFHYDSLTMTVDKPAAGESEIVLRLKGNNPEVLEGHPFDFTINLTGDLAPLLSTLAEGNRLSSELLQRLWRLRR